jgi:ankyrin repeat protein
MSQIGQNPDPQAISAASSPETSKTAPIGHFVPVDSQEQEVAKRRRGELAVALRRAITADNDAAAELALAEGADARARDEEGRDALMLAARRGSEAIARRLLPLCDAKAVDFERASALMHAARCSPACVELLLGASDAQARNQSDESALAIAARQGLAQGVRALLPASDPMEVDRWGATPLMRACASGAAECVEILLGASEIDAQDGMGDTALSWAAKAGDARAVALLLEAGVSSRLCGASGKTPMIWALERGHEECARLLAPVSDIDARTRNGKGAYETARSLPPSSKRERLLAIVREEKARLERDALAAAAGVGEGDEARDDGEADGAGGSQRRARAL